MGMKLTRARFYQQKWQQIAQDSMMQAVPGKLETGPRNAVLVIPHEEKHIELQEDLHTLLSEHAPDGWREEECAVTTPMGVKQVDVAWMTPPRREKMGRTGHPPTVAPQICIEIDRADNERGNLETRRDLYFDAGAEEVWVVDEGGRIQFFREGEEMDSSRIAPECPNHTE